MNIESKKCKFCGKLFIPKVKHAKYCPGPHYMKCPVCNKEYKVTNNENLKRPPVACSYACRKIRTQQTSLSRYGIKAPGNNPEAREKAKATMQQKYGVDYAMQNEELKQRAIEGCLQKYGVENIQKLHRVNERSIETRDKEWIELKHKLLPIKKTQPLEQPKFYIDESAMDVFVLTEKASTSFLMHYGHNVKHKFRKKHLSLGLAQNGILYQVIRFEQLAKHEYKDSKVRILLSDFGTRFGYFNPNYYTKLIHFAIDVRGIDDYISIIPKYVENEEINSLQLTLVKSMDYDVYWKLTEDDNIGLIKLTNWHNIPEMLKQHDYITSDYLGMYIHQNN